MAGLELSVRLLVRDWHSHLEATDFADGVAKYDTDLVDRELSKTTVTTADQPVSVDQAAAKNDRFVVRHEIIRVVNHAAAAREWIDKPGTTQTFQIGDILEEHIQVINPEDRNFVTVVAPLAAGVEPMNPNLATAPREAQPSQPATRGNSPGLRISVKRAD